MNPSKTWLLYSFALLLCFLMFRCDCQDYAQVACIRDVDCGPCSICFDRQCEKDMEICGDQVDNDCDGETDEECDDVCDGVVCNTPPPRECLDGSTLRYFLSPGRCVEGSCDYESTDVVCDAGCENDQCTGDMCIGLICDDNNVCTVGEECVDGVCQPGSPVECSDGIDCTQDYCDVFTGCGNMPDDSGCDDGDICTDNTCDITSGCSNVYNTAPCDDSDPCTMSDSCNQGVCQGVPLDADGDGFVPTDCGGEDCDDSDFLTNPDAEELCNGKDNNCDGLVDMVGTDLCNYEAICQEGNLVYCTGAQGPVVVPSVIDVNTLWCARQSPLILQGDAVVLADTALTVGPCVRFEAADGTHLNVRGNLEVKGDQSYPAVFTSNSNTPQRGSWGGIQIQNCQGGKAFISGAIIEYASSGFSVESCWQGGPFQIVDSIFQENETAFSGYAGEDEPLIVEIRRTKIYNNTCGSSNADKVFYDSEFTGNDEALCGTERISLYDCTVTDNVVGLRGGRGTVQNCIIANNTDVGVMALFQGFELIGNTIVNNRIGVTADDYDGAIPPMHQNTICDNSDYDVELVTPYDVDCTNNWWCTTDPDVISSRIYDVYDDANLGRVIFEPFLEEEP